MQDADKERLRQAAEIRAREVQALVQGRSSAIVEWWDGGADASSATAFRIDNGSETLHLNRELVERWFAELAGQQAEKLVAGLTYRAVAALLFAPPRDLWSEMAEAHVRAEQAQGLGDDFARAFHAAHRILESQRLDQLLLHYCPDAVAELTEWVCFELEEHPTFDTYPRAAILLGRPHLPVGLVQPALDELVDDFGADEAGDLTETLRGYVSLESDDVDGMVEATATLVFQAFPETMGLTRGHADEQLTSTDMWPLQMRPPVGEDSGWGDLEYFLAHTFAAFTGDAGLDYGDALVIGLSDEGISGPHLGAFSSSGVIALQIAGIDLSTDARQELVSRGWETFDNAPEGLHKEASVRSSNELAGEVVWLLRDLAQPADTADITLWGRGPAADVADSMGWDAIDLELLAACEPTVTVPTDHVELVSLVRDALRNMTGLEPDEYATGSFVIESDELEFAVLVTEEMFPAVRFHHRVIEVPEESRPHAIEFANALHGRSSTLGAHWWVGDEHLWQVSMLWATKFDEEIFLDHLGAYINIASERTPEIRGRFDGGWDSPRGS